MWSYVDLEHQWTFKNIARLQTRFYVIGLNILNEMFLEELAKKMSIFLF